MPQKGLAQGPVAGEPEGKAEQAGGRTSWLLPLKKITFHQNKISLYAQLKKKSQSPRQKFKKSYVESSSSS
jgi:hypothetical protein